MARGRSASTWTWVAEAQGRLTDEGVPSQWKKAVVQARNDFGHSFDHGWLNGESIDLYVAVMGVAALATHLCPALETGIANETLAGRFDHHQPYQLFLKQAPAWLPKVYPSPKAPSGR